VLRIVCPSRVTCLLAVLRIVCPSRVTCLPAVLRIVCPSRVTCLPAECYGSSYEDLIKHVGLVEN
jgi:hypothetical protein